MQQWEQSDWPHLLCGLVDSSEGDHSEEEREREREFKGQQLIFVQSETRSSDQVAPCGRVVLLLAPPSVEVVPLLLLLLFYVCCAQWIIQRG